MKLSSILVSAAALLLLAACNSLDNPIANLFHHKSEGDRVYNPQTGQWEYPNAKHNASSDAAAGATGSHGSDTRYWDAQRNQWVEEPQHGGDSAKPKPAASDAASASAPAVPAPTPRPSHAIGVYNTSTGRIDWEQKPDYGAPPATPVPKKHWYWPF